MYAQEKKYTIRQKRKYQGSRLNFKNMKCDFPMMISNQSVPRLHIEMIGKKVATYIGMMKYIKPYVPANTLQTIYRELICHTLITVLFNGESVTNNYLNICES